MKIYYELDLETFEAWSGAKSTLERIREEGLCSTLENILEDLYPDGMSDTELNDLLWFDSDSVYEWLGMRSESVIQEELEEAKQELTDIQEEADDLMADYDGECIGIADWERKEIWEEEYADSWEDIQERMEEAMEKVNELEEEWNNI